jgi:hypothetical protein
LFHGATGSFEEKLMEVTSGTPGKRPRTKGKASIAQGAQPTVTKKPRTRRKAAPVAELAAPVEMSKPTLPSDDEVSGMIATAAYYIAAERNFTPGRELDDWLEAERRIRAVAKP